MATVSASKVSGWYRCCCIDYTGQDS